MKKLYNSKIIYFSFYFFLVLSGNYVNAQYVRWSTDFDNAITNLTYSPAVNNIWQVGSTTKTFFGAANSLPNAIMTDTINLYQPGSNSSFVISCNFYSIQFQGYLDNHIYIDFDHKYQTTAGHDGGAVEVSYDNLNWQNVLLDTLFINHNECVGFQPPQAYNFYADTDTLFNGQPGFSGQSNGWVHSQLWWCWYMTMGPESQFTQPDSMWLRFTFYSDTIADSLDGWMIDNIVLMGDNPGSVAELNSQSVLKVFPQPANDIMELEMLNAEIPETLAIYDLTGRIVLTDKITGSKIDINRLAPGNYILTVKSISDNLYRTSFVKN